MSLTNNPSNARRYCLFGRHLFQAAYLKQKKWYTSGKWSIKSPLQKVIDGECRATKQNLSKYVNKAPSPIGDLLPKSKAVSCVKDDVVSKVEDDESQQKLGTFDGEKYTKSVALYVKAPKRRMRGNKVDKRETSVQMEPKEKSGKGTPTKTSGKSSANRNGTKESKEEKEKVSNSKKKKQENRTGCHRHRQGHQDQDVGPVEERTRTKSHFKAHEDDDKTDIDIDIANGNNANVVKAYKKAARKRLEKPPSMNFYEKMNRFGDINTIYRLEPSSESALSVLHRTKNRNFDPTTRPIPSYENSDSTKCKKWYTKKLIEAKLRSQNIFEARGEQPDPKSKVKSNERASVSPKETSERKRKVQDQPPSNSQLKQKKSKLEKSPETPDRTIKQIHSSYHFQSHSHSQTQPLGNINYKSESVPGKNVGSKQEMKFKPKPKPKPNQPRSLYFLDPQAELKREDDDGDDGDCDADWSTKQIHFSKNSPVATTLSNCKDTPIKRQKWYNKRHSDMRIKTQALIQKIEEQKANLAQVGHKDAVNKPVTLGLANYTQRNQPASELKSKESPLNSKERRQAESSNSKKDKRTPKSKVRNPLPLDSLDPQYELNIDDDDEDDNDESLPGKGTQQRSITKSFPAGPGYGYNASMKNKKWYSKSMSELIPKSVENQAEATNNNNNNNNIYIENKPTIDVRLSDIASETEPVTSNFSRLNSAFEGQQWQSFKSEKRFTGFVNPAAKSTKPGSPPNLRVNENIAINKAKQTSFLDSTLVNQQPQLDILDPQSELKVNNCDSESEEDKANFAIKDWTKDAHDVEPKVICVGDSKIKEQLGKRIAEKVSVIQPISFSSLHLSDRISLDQIAESVAERDGLYTNQLSSEPTKSMVGKQDEIEKAAEAGAAAATNPLTSLKDIPVSSADITKPAICKINDLVSNPESNSKENRKKKAQSEIQLTGEEEKSENVSQEPNEPANLQNSDPRNKLSQSRSSHLKNIYKILKSN